jgi:multicomponent Na+:H+ antiporter subunit E
MTMKNAFLWNIFLALAWVALTEQLSLASLVVGFGIGYAILWFAQRLLGPSRYFSKAPLAIALAAFFVWQLVLASLRVVHDVVTPTHYARPGVVAVPLDAETDVEITLLANLVSLTPGTVSLDVSEDRRTLYIHAMFIDDPDAVRRGVKQGFERRVLALLR